MIEVIPVVSSVVSIVFTAVVGYLFTRVNKAQEQRDELALKTRVLIAERIDAQSEYLDVLTSGCTKAFNNLEKELGLANIQPFNGNVETIREKNKQISKKFQHVLYQRSFKDVD